MKKAKKIVDGSTTNGKAYPVQPQHIDGKASFREPFGNRGDMQDSATIVVRFCQRRVGWPRKGRWLPFTQQQIDEFNGGEKVLFCHLLHPTRGARDETSYVILGPDGKYRVTHEFIAKCFEHAPAPW